MGLGEIIVGIIFLLVIEIIFVSEVFDIHPDHTIGGRIVKCLVRALRRSFIGRLVKWLYGK